jgi:hypothetical protein
MGAKRQTNLGKCDNNWVDPFFGPQKVGVHSQSAREVDQVPNRLVNPEKMAYSFRYEVHGET